ncbi:hypothetical protein LTR37_000830 [Vermiconidia calcicola]|uniref:Uncharacterized protein n=1 Tax=Vermiconidia calcicola TaxID=1690605 RepID=A0ACC3NYW9_9PEZI|nr:hypothetical protein LTR37_000830 [Vermiconidia calcicola]
MPPRLARSSVQIANPKNARNKNRKRTLDAYAIASHSTPANPRLKSRERLGEYLGDDGPKQKRRRVVQTPDEDGEESVEEEVSAPKKKSRGVDEDVEEGNDSEGNAWTLGGMREGESDSDLDSDEAFGESDKEKFEGFTFRGSSSNKGKKTAVKSERVAVDADMDLNEAESGYDDDEEDDFGDEGVDLATMLDDNDEELLGSKDKTGEDMGDESASDDDSDEDASASESQSESEEEDDTANDEERTARMRDRLEALDAIQQPKLSTSQPPIILTVDDLLATLDLAARNQYNAALKTRKKSTRPTTLTAPLPKRQQDRLNREVASTKAKEQLDRWRDTVIQNRRAEFLSFPLKDPDRQEPIGKEKFVTDGKPRNELEENVRRIMVESGMASDKPGGEEDVEDAIMKSEELATNKLPVEEVMRRRAELRRTRDLLFREERKAKRIAKIKSKSYRRVHRRERLRQAELEKGLVSDNEDQKEVADRKRAEARMGTKHKDSKWAKSLRDTNRTVWDEGARESVNEEARRREELRRRVGGSDVEDGSGVSSDEGDDMYEPDGDEGGSVLKQLDRLSSKAKSSNGADAGREGKGLQGLKFMRAADERRRAQNDEDVERLRRELAIEDGNEVESDEGGEIEDQGLGRAIFGPKGKEKKDKAKEAKRAEMEEGEESEGEDEEDGEVDVVTERPATNGKSSSKSKSTMSRGLLAGGMRSDRSDAGKGNNADSEWLPAQMPSKHKKRREDKVDGSALVIVAPSDHAGKANGQSRNRTKSTKVDGRALVSASKPLDAEKANGQLQNRAESTKQAAQKQVAAPAADTQAGNTDGWTLVKHKDNDDDQSDPDHEDPVLNPAELKSSYHRRAFAGDDVQTHFAVEKADLAASEDEKEADSSYLPGWGSWTGAGLSRSIRRANQKTKQNPLFKAKTPGGTKQQDRQDAKLPNVIVSEKQARKGKGYMAPILPHGFETKEQYERSLRVPVGPEWTTKEVFQRGTRPRVVVRPGTVVKALERPLV